MAERNNMFGELTSFNKEGLNPTNTVVHHNTFINEAGVTSPITRGHADFEDSIEYFDDPVDFRAKIKKLAKLVKESKHLVVYTGAGISTAASLPDYRGPQGVWTMKDKGLEAPKSISLEAARPTYTHMALASLAKAGVLKAVVTTNIDGLHLRSGIDKEAVLELHGNAHTDTGSVINFGQSLPKETYDKADKHSMKSDLALVLGTSLRVKPACMLPQNSYEYNNGNMVIVNLQKTPFDEKAAACIRGSVDDVMQLLMQELSMDVDMTLPDGTKLPERTLPDIDSIHNEKRKNVAKQVKTLKKKQGDLIVGTVNNKKRGCFFVENQRFDTQTKKVLDKHNKSDALYVANCANGDFTISSTCAKLIIERCENCSFTVTGKVITAIGEVIDTTNCTLHICVPMYTLTIDKSENITVAWRTPHLLKNIYTNRYKAVQIVYHKSLPAYKVPEVSEDNITETYITHIVANELQTELVIREGIGYATTVREKKIADDKLEKNLKIMEKAFRAM